MLVYIVLKNHFGDREIDKIFYSKDKAIEYVSGKEDEIRTIKECRVEK